MNFESVPARGASSCRDTGNFTALEAPDEVARILRDDGPRSDRP